MCKLLQNIISNILHLMSENKLYEAKLNGKCYTCTHCMDAFISKPTNAVSFLVNIYIHRMSWFVLMDLISWNLLILLSGDYPTLCFYSQNVCIPPSENRHSNSPPIYHTQEDKFLYFVVLILINKYILMFNENIVTVTKIIVDID